jgi:serine/threonine-protein phosphatase 2A regulatory subunit B
MHLTHHTPTTETICVFRVRCLQVVPHEVRMVSRAKRIFSSAHTYHINSIGVSSDQATFLSADDLRINLWSLEVPNRCFTMVDIKPANMEELSEVCYTKFELCHMCCCF